MDDRMIVASPAMKRVVQSVIAVAPFDVPVFLSGESGTGKELAARRLHLTSRRCRRALVPVNCAALPDTLVEAELFGHTRGAFTGATTARQGLLDAADGGTLFLDEVAELSARAQTTLLRALQEKEYRRLGDSGLSRSDFRVVSASHKDLDNEVAAGRFRPDLLFRLRVVRVHIPPLRERRPDIPVLARYLAEHKALEIGLRPRPLTTRALEVLSAYSWPGNVRELENEIVQGLVRAQESTALDTTHLSATLEHPAERGLRFASRSLERRLVEEALVLAGGNRSRAARTLGVSRQTLYRKLKRYAG